MPAENFATFVAALAAIANKEQLFELSLGDMAVRLNVAVVPSCGLLSVTVSLLPRRRRR